MSPVLAFGAGLIALVLGGELLVRGAVAAARRLDVSPLLIGLTLVGFGTSTPELVTSVEAALNGAPGIAVGNVIGSNTANVLLIVGAAAIVRPIAVDIWAVRRDAAVMLASALVAAVALIFLGGVDRLTGTVFLLSLAIYVIWTYRQERANSRSSATLHVAGAESVKGARGSLVSALGLAYGGLTLTLLGAGWFVEGAIWLARASGVSESVIGLTVVAVGTSLPELSTGLAAAARGHSDVALGNVLGSNIYNVLGILGTTGIVVPVTTPMDLTILDLAVMLVATVLLLPVAITGKRITRGEGAFFLFLYTSYISYLIL